MIDHIGVLRMLHCNLWRVDGDSALTSCWLAVLADQRKHALQEVQRSPPGPLVEPRAIA